MNNRIKLVIIAMASLVLVMLMGLCVFLESRTIPTSPSAPEITIGTEETTDPIVDATVSGVDMITPPETLPPETTEVTITVPVFEPTQPEATEPEESDVTETPASSEPEQTEPAPTADPNEGDMSDWA